MRRLTLTFDNGPWPGATDTVLKILAERSVRATFFVVGERLRARGSRPLAERAKAAGHWIGNHTMTHGVPLGLRNEPNIVEQEIGATEALIGDLAHPDKLFRPHGKGSLGPHLLSRAAADFLIARSYTVVTWNNVPRDWVEPRAAWPERALAAIAEQPWSVLVLHEHYLEGMMESLSRFLDCMLAEEVAIVQEFPEDCTPLRRGEPQDTFWRLVSDMPSVESVSN
jgi:peptidoglycan/xylan/chitin deacetylase (PgdA/CDA1 family)